MPRKAPRCPQTSRLVVSDPSDPLFMGEALALARTAAALGDVPVGAVIVEAGRVIARGYNRRERDRDPTAHAEMEALRKAAAALGTWRLVDCTVYATLEPCPMCAGALLQARVRRLVFGAADPKAGAAGSVVDVLADGRFNHVVAVTAGVRAEECAALLRRFFASRRPGAG